MYLDEYFKCISRRHEKNNIFSCEIFICTYVASMTDGATGRQDGYLTSSDSENSNFLSAYGYTLVKITKRDISGSINSN